MSLEYVSHKACKLRQGIPVSSQCQRRQIKFWQLAFRRCVVSRRWRRAFGNTRRTGRRWTDVNRIHVNCVHSLWSRPLSWLDPDRPSALYYMSHEESGRQDNESYISLPMSAAVALGFILVALKSAFNTHSRRRRAATWERTLIFFWRHVMQPVLLRVYFGRLRCVISACLGGGATRPRGLLTADDCDDG